MAWSKTGNIKGPSGNNGADGKTILSGVVSPVSGVGSNGDFYLDTAANRLYGPKASGAWGSGVSLVGPTGPAGANATLGNATPLAAGSASAGSSTSAARDDHRHPLQAGTLTSLGNVTISETLLISLALGIQRKTATLSGVAVGDKLLFAPNGVPTAGCEAVNVYASATNQVTVSCFLPALGIGATYSIPVTVFRVA